MTEAEHVDMSRQITILMLVMARHGGVPARPFQRLALSWYRPRALFEVTP